VAFLESLVTGDIAGLADGTGSLSVFTNEKGGIIDDTVITKVGSFGSNTVTVLFSFVLLRFWDSSLLRIIADTVITKVGSRGVKPHLIVCLRFWDSSLLLLRINYDTAITKVLSFEL
jgi:hypothetical protein